MSIPEITHLQFLVLGLLIDAPQAGRQIRADLHEHDVRRTAPAFYQMMARLEDSGWVTGWYEQSVADGQILKERHYRLTAAGLRAWRATRDFYATRLRGLDPATEISRG
jgi:DNA-binding PadR family transcriptional regulator